MGADSGVCFVPEVEAANFPFEFVENGFYALPKYCFFVDKQPRKWYAKKNLSVEVVNLSKVKYPNRDALRDANDIYLDTMRPFIIHHLKQVQGEKVENLIEDALDPGQADKFWEKLDEDNDIESAIDFSYFPQIIQKQWKNAFGQRFSWDLNFQSMLWLIRKGRNSCEHRGKKDLDSEFVRINLFLIADVLGKINRPDEQREVESIRDKLFDDTTEQLVATAVEAEKTKYEKNIVEVEKRLAAEKASNKELSKKVADNAVKLDEKTKKLEKISGQLVDVKLSKKEYEKRINSTSKQLERVQTAHSACEERLTAAEAEKDNYRERFETASKELEAAETEWQACEDSRRSTSERLEEAVEEWVTCVERLTAMRKLFTVATIGNQTVQAVYPPIETDSNVRILDRRGVEKKNYLLALLEQKEPTLIYVQNEEMADWLLEHVVPGKSGTIGKHPEQTSEAEEIEILKRLEHGGLIAVVSNTLFSVLAPSHCVKHFVFFQLAPSLDEFFKRCEPAFTSRKNTYLHLIYEEQDVEGLEQWLTRKYPDEKPLRKLYLELKELAETDGNFIKPGNVYNKKVYSKLHMEKSGVETGLAIFEELQFLERNGRGVKLLPDPEKRGLDESEIYCGGEELKQGIAETQAFQLKQPIEQIWEEIQEKLDVDSEQILREVNTDEMYASISEAENGQQPAEAVENDSTADNEDTESEQAPKAARANAKVTKEQVREIRSRSAAGESNSELAEEDIEQKPEVKHSEFWAPIRNGEFGELFAGKPVPIRDENWIAKTIRNISVCLFLINQRCYVQLYFGGENRSERREKIMTLFPKSEYAYTYRDSPRETKVQFPVLDKGRKNQDDWNEIREKLVAMGTDIYNKINMTQHLDIIAQPLKAEEDIEQKPEVKQSEFWQPIRDGEFGALFAGRPVRVRDDGFISKQIRGVELILSFRKNRSYVSFLCTGENRIERRDEIIALFPETDYDYSPRESPQRAGFEFPVINKGKDHPEDWDEIRKKLVAMGTDIYNKIDESDL